MNARAMALFGMLAFCAAAQAKTVAWYRFEEEPCGTITTGDTVFTNTIDATKYPAYARVMTGSKNNKYPSNLSTDSARMPIYTNAFPETIELVNAADCSRLVPNRRAVDVRNPVDSYNNPASVILIDDHEDLRLQTFTLEFFAWIPRNTTNYRTIVAKNGGIYDSKRRAFEITTTTSAAGTYNIVLGIASVVDPLYNSSGVVTNATAKTAKGSIYGASDDRWHHIALVVDGAKKKATMYLDYEPNGSITYTGDLYYEPGYPISFGGNVQCYYYSHAGAFDEIRISDTALAPTDFLRYRASQEVLPTPAAVDADTLLYFDFEGSMTEGFGVGDMAKPVFPFYANKAANLSYAGWNFSSLAALKSGVTNRVSHAPSADVPHESVRFGLRGAAATEDVSSFSMMTNSPANDWVDGVMLPTAVTTNLFCDSTTIEAYIKMPASGYLSNANQTHLFCLLYGFQIITPGSGIWSTGALSASFGNVDLKRKDGSSTVSSIYVNDNKWHHVALVYDKERRCADFYIDRSWQLGGSNMVFSTWSNNYWPNFTIGASYWRDRCFFNLKVDDLRITRGALRPYQFLTTIPLEPPADELARASFDGDLVLTPYTNYFGAAGTASAFTSGGAAPAFTLDKPGRKITAGKDGDVLKAVNHGALAFAGGKVEYAKRALVADEETFTAEFFVKCASAASGAGLVKVVRGADEATNPLIWSLGFADASGNLALKVCTDGENVQSHPFGGAVADGAWHHVAVRFSAGGTDGTAEVFRDGVQLGAWTFDGRLPSRPRTADLVLGAGDDATAGFTGVLDELRMTAGFLSAEQFMYASTPGLAFVIR